MYLPRTMDVTCQLQCILVFFFLTRVSHQCGHVFSCNEQQQLLLGKCCNISEIPFNSLEVEYLVVNGTSLIQPSDTGQRWRLDATVKWQAPSEDDGYTYSIDFRPTITLEDLQFFRGETIADSDRCDEDIRSYLQCPSTHYFSTVVEEENAYFTSLLFGFYYEFQIQVIYNGVASQTVTCYFDCPETRLLVPDCLVSTGDVEFCQNQPIPVATEPRDLEVEWTEGPLSAMVNIKWSKPLVVNGNVASYTIYGHRLANLENETVFFIRIENITAIQVTSDHHGIRNRGFIIGFAYIIEVTPEVNLPAQYHSSDTHNGNSARKQVNITVEVDKTTPYMKMITKRRGNASTPSTTNPPTKVQPQLVVIALSISAACIVLIVLSAVVLLVYRRHRGSAVDDTGVIFQVHATRHKGEREVLAKPEFREKEVYDTDRIELVGQPIGSGQYGKVYIGYLRLEKDTDKKIKVAVKTTKDGLHASMQEEFLDEIRLMLEIGVHPNIMPVIACKTVSEPCYLVTEYMDYGSLKDYLRKCNKPENVENDPNYILTGHTKLKIAHQISTGMAYLSNTRYFHGDLAARNVLIKKNMEVKISDFGLSNDIYARGYIRLPPENKRPVKWYSPEANIHGRCSTKGDVWSYGIVLHEIYCFGQEPYPGMAPREVIVRVNAGYRLEKPEGCPDEVYDIMSKCWQYEPSLRPNFESIKQSLELILASGDFMEEGKVEDK